MLLLAHKALEELKSTSINGKPIKIMLFHQKASASRSGAGIIHTKVCLIPNFFFHFLIIALSGRSKQLTSLNLTNIL